MITRIWHGYTTKANAGTYEELLRKEIFVGIEFRRMKGFKGIHLLRRDLDKETEFITIMWFDSIDAVKEFAGADYEKAVVPPAARKLLKRFDKVSAHYEIRHQNPEN